MKVDITNTASESAGLLADLRVGGASGLRRGGAAMTEALLLVVLICAWAWVCQMAADLFFGR